VQSLYLGCAALALGFLACSEPQPGQSASDPGGGVEAGPEVGAPADARTKPEAESDAEVAPPPDADAAVPTDAPAPSTACGEYPEVVTLFEAHDVLLEGGLTPPLGFEVPQQAVSVTVTVEGPAGYQLGLASWEAPGHVLVQEGWQSESWENSFGLCMTCANRFALADSVFATLAPNNPATAVPKGANTLVVMAQIPPADWGDVPTPGTGSVRVTVRAKLGGVPAQTGVIDLNLHFTGAKDWTAAGAAQNQELAALLAKVAELYAQVGIGIGLVTYHDVDPQYQVLETIDGPQSDLGQMFGAAEPERPNAINLFFVEEIVGGFGGFGVLLGIAGGIPGPPLEQGTAKSGVAIAMQEVDGAPAGRETTAAHEMGHFLGLFHTVEVLGITDPLPDTGEGPEWLMHNQGAGTSLSPQQGDVMRANPWVCSGGGTP
jgi:hypothetical protein